MTFINLFRSPRLFPEPAAAMPQPLQLSLFRCLLCRIAGLPSHSPRLQRCTLMRTTPAMLLAFAASAKGLVAGPTLYSWTRPLYQPSLPVMAVESWYDSGERLAGKASSVAAPAVAEKPAAVKEATTTVTIPSREPTMMDERIYNFNKIVIDTVYDIICLLYPVTGGPRDFARFYVLETVARVPYFAYLSVMHLRETFGERTPGDSERMRTHYAEADNELHHLLIMESLGGNSSVIDRTVAQTMAFAYYWYVTAVYAISEPAAYHLSELIEDHAFNTYDKFLSEHEKKLKTMPVPDIARKYYERDNPFLFDLFCTVPEPADDGTFRERRPKLETLYDVFVNIRDDEREHWKTLCNLVQYDDMQGVGGMVQPTKAQPVVEAGTA